MPAGLINSRDLWSTSGWFTAASLSRIYTTAADRFMEDSTAWSLLPPLSSPRPVPSRHPPPLTTFPPSVPHLLRPASPPSLLLPPLPFSATLSFVLSRTYTCSEATREYSISHGRWSFIYVRIGARRSGVGDGERGRGDGNRRGIRRWEYRNEREKGKDTRTKP